MYSIFLLLYTISSSTLKIYNTIFGKMFSNSLTTLIFIWPLKNIKLKNVTYFFYRHVNFWTHHTNLPSINSNSSFHSTAASQIFFRKKVTKMFSRKGKNQFFKRNFLKLTTIKFIILEPWLIKRTSYIFFLNFTILRRPRSNKVLHLIIFFLIFLWKNITNFSTPMSSFSEMKICTAFSSHYFQPLR